MGEGNGVDFSLFYKNKTICTKENGGFVGK